MVKKAVTIPVIGNGDVNSGTAALEMLSRTGCDSIMIGRGALGNPWVFDECRSMIEGRPVSPVSPAERGRTIVRHLSSYAEVYGEARAAAEMKKQAAWYLRGQPGVAAARRAIFSAASTREIRDIVVTFFGI